MNLSHVIRRRHYRKNLTGNGCKLDLQERHDVNFFSDIANPPKPTTSQKEKNSKPLTGARLYGHLICAYTWQLVKLNVLFVLSCIPLVTIPAALAAMTDVLAMIVERRMVFVWRDYRTAWIRNWKRAYVVGLPYCLGMVVAVVGVRFYLSLQSPVGIALAGVCCMLAACGFVAGAYVFMMVVRTPLRGKEIWRNATLLIPMRLGVNVAILLLDIATFAIGMLLFPWMLFVLLLFGLSLMGLAGAVASLEGIKAFVIK